MTKAGILVTRVPRHLACVFSGKLYVIALPQWCEECKTNKTEGIKTRLPPQKSQSSPGERHGGRCARGRRMLGKILVRDANSLPRLATKNKSIPLMMMK